MLQELKGSELRPTFSQLYLSGVLAETVGGVASIAADGPLAVRGQEAGLTDAVHGLVAESVDAVGRADADVAVLASPTGVAAEIDQLACNCHCKSTQSL